MIGIFLASTAVVANTQVINPKNIVEIKNFDYNDNFEDAYEFDLQKSGKYILEPFPPKTDEQIEKMIINPQMTFDGDDLPSQFSWLNFNGNWMTTAKDQGSCGSCWAFGALGALESAINIASGYHDLDIDLSEQYVLSCLSAAGSCSGGWMSEAIEYIQSTDSGSTGNGVNGCTIESCMPYQAVDYIPCSDKCTDWDYLTDPPQDDNKLWEVLDYGITSIDPTDGDDWDLLKSWIWTYGPLSIDIYASSGWRNFGWSYHSPNDVYEPSGSDSGITNHAQVLCGWVDDASVKNGGYWIIKNSWGPDFGYNGYTNVAYGTISLGDRDVTWVKAPEWPQQEQGPGPGPIDMHVFADYEWEPKYPKLGEEIEFTDTSEGNVVLWEWDFDGDGIIDSNDKRPDWTYNAEGEYEVKLTVWSTWGLSSDRTYTIGAKEVWPPVSVIKPENYADNEQTIQFEGRYSYDVDEGGHIVSYHWDFGDGETSTDSHPEHYYANGDQIYEVTLTVTDNDGASTSKTVEVKIDQTVPPVTVIKHGFGNNGETWYSDTQRISFDATDWTDVIYTYYRIDDPGGDWNSYNPSQSMYIPVSSEGEHLVECYSVDYYGNVEDVVSETFYIDKTAPELFVNIQGNMVEDIYIPDVTVTITGEDGLSGINSFKYRLDSPLSSDWNDYLDPIIISDGGSHIIECLAVDKAGNSHIEQYTINMDHAPSMPTITGSSSGNPNIEYSYEIISDDIEDDQISYFVDWDDGTNTGWTDYYDSNEKITLSHIWSEQGTYIVKVKAKDNKGAISKVGTLAVQMPLDQMDLIRNPQDGRVYSKFTGENGINLGFLLGDMSLFIQTDIIVSADISGVDMVEFSLEKQGIITETKELTSNTNIYSYNFGRKSIGFYKITAKAYIGENLIEFDTVENILSIST